MFKRCVCGKFFSALTEKQKYCSEECRPKKNYYTAKPIVKKTCEQCKRPYTTRREKQRFCSRQCREKYHKIEQTWHEKICPCCKKKFKTSKAYQRYCSDTCYRIIKRKRDLQNLNRIREEKNGTKHTNVPIPSTN